MFDYEIKTIQSFQFYFFVLIFVRQVVLNSSSDEEEMLSLQILTFGH